MKVFLTGQKGIGKTTCINTFIKECLNCVSLCGFQARPFYEKGTCEGFYLHALCECERNDIRFCAKKEGKNVVIPGMFDSFGVEILKRSQAHTSCVMVLDEIGFLEKEESRYLAALLECIETFPNIIGVLKKCDMPYIEWIKKREDVLVLDMDEMSFEDTLEEIKKIWEKEASDAKKQ